MYCGPREAQDQQLCGRGKTFILDEGLKARGDDFGLSLACASDNHEPFISGSLGDTALGLV